MDDDTSMKLCEVKLERLEESDLDQAHTSETTVRRSVRSPKKVKQNAKDYLSITKPKSVSRKRRQPPEPILDYDLEELDNDNDENLVPADSDDQDFSPMWKQFKERQLISKKKAKRVKCEPESDIDEDPSNPWRRISSFNDLLCYKCPECAYTTTRQDSMQNHAKNKHKRRSRVFFNTMREIDKKKASEIDDYENYEEWLKNGVKETIESIYHGYDENRTVEVDMSDEDFDDDYFYTPTNVQRQENVKLTVDLDNIDENAEILVGNPDDILPDGAEIKRGPSPTLEEISMRYETFETENDNDAGEESNENVICKNDPAFFGDVIEEYTLHDGVRVTKIRQTRDVLKTLNFAVNIPAKSNKKTKETRESLVKAAAERLGVDMTSKDNAECQYCDEIFDNAYLMIIHWMETHSKHLKMCNLCLKICTTSAEYQEHFFYQHPFGTRHEYRCNICPLESNAEFIVDQQGHMYKHYEESHPGKKFYIFKCVRDNCGREFKRAAQLKSHHTMDHDKILPICDVCGRAVKKLEQHMKEHREIPEELRYSVKCDRCDYATHDRKYLMNHIRVRHDVHLHVPCDVCLKTFPWKSEMLAHKDQYHPDRLENPTEVCADCGRQFVTQFIYRQHMKKCNVGGTVKRRGAGTTLTCEYCREGVRIAKFQEHCRDHHTNMPIAAHGVDIIDTCKSCDAVFISRQGMMMHMYRRHDVLLTKQVCSKCRIPYNKVHNCGTKTKWYKASVVKIKCRRCPKKIAKNRMREHILSVHEKRLDFACEYCEQAYASERLLKRHKTSVHMSNYQCEYCNKIVKGKSFLIQHKVKAHNDTSGAYFCDMCPKKVFVSETSLRSHLKFVHGAY